MARHFVDLTLEDEEDVVVVASNPVNSRDRDPSVAWEYAPRGQNQPASFLQSFSPRRTNSPVIKQSPGSRLPARFESASASAHEEPQPTPSKSARFSGLENSEPLTSSLQSRTQPSSAPSVPPAPLPTQNPRNSTPQPLQRPSKEQRTPRMQTPNGLDWTVDQIAAKLDTLVGQVRRDHGHLVEFELEEAEKKAPAPNHLTAFDDFADMKCLPLEGFVAPGPETEVITVKFKQHTGEHGKQRGTGKKIPYPSIIVKCETEPVPVYRFHHVEIRKNILTPNTMLNFVPHLRDVDPNSAEEKKYSNWLAELDKLDTQSGFKTQDRLQKLNKREREEYAATLSMYLEPWLQKLAIDGCTKSTLIRFMASQPEHDDAITPKQKSTILNTYSQDTGPQTDTVAKLFTEAFDRIFNAEDKQPAVSLRDILLLDKSVETIVDNKLAKETPSSQKHRDADLLPQLEGELASYACLGCLICFSHDCEHGEFDADNQRVCLAVVNNGGLTRTLEGKWRAQIDAQGGNTQSNKAVLHQPCKRDCYRSYDVGNPAQTVEPWSENEVNVLKAVFATMGYSTTLTAHCFVAAGLGRPCWDVRRKFVELNLSLPPIQPRPDPPKVKPLSWYDRKKRQLIGDWQDCTTTHEHALREPEYNPCHHDGPCTAANKCPCALAYPRPILCERFCHCTAEECALKFTGCACHSSGKTCLQKQKEGKPCICVQLNRECDPILCKGCGAKDRADPENAHDEHLHSTGCQNVPLQRGAYKVLMLGKSQLEGCGYGLFTAEDIAQDEFLIEYTGELITHDEGVRREARRGDVFDELHTTSYLFTLLEEGGIWVDAAIYGNLSRYINHASEHDKKGCNITPKIMYVNHEFRIKFTALRDIKAGEELFFNYGDNFPNLTKKLLEQDEDKTGQAGGKRKSGAQRAETARNTTTKNGAKGKGKKRALNPNGFDEDDPMYWIDGPGAMEDEADDWEEDHPRRRKKRGGRRPGAGRKKKVVVDANQPRTEINDSQDEGSLIQSGNIDTPSRSKRLHGSGPELGTNAGTRHKPAAGQEPPVKKVSKRGGARPGAGRKPKHPKPQVVPKATDGSPSDVNMVDGATPDKDSRNRVLEYTSSSGAAPVAADFPAAPSFAQTGSSGALSPIPAMNRKRKATQEPEQVEDEITASSTRRNGGAGGVSGNASNVQMYAQEGFQPIEGSNEDDEDDEPLGRPRKRPKQMPARYRTDEQ
ncbi:hypothetical protein B0T16DRAFT_401629 [Cercophora newfieldiana]|uniref:SET domain-containing protein n=1 Tax=Cercophora newfieldiana TaxID=92897 RepID=A0AA39YTZ1_9PEZI|nr:hypothetical protein B0T16DRAFT_401629 [Cercophora newfieldiana]